MGLRRSRFWPPKPPPHAARSFSPRLPRCSRLDQIDAWALHGLPAKNTLQTADAQLIEDAFAKKLTEFLSERRSEDSGAHTPLQSEALSQCSVAAGAPALAAAQALNFEHYAVTPKPRRLRDKRHRQFVSAQPCILCGRQPSDAHHLRFTQPRALGRKVSDEFTVPLCRMHHRELHRTVKEQQWWLRMGIDPLPIADKLWAQTQSSTSETAHSQCNRHLQYPTDWDTMTSLKQFETNRRNAQKSTGPKSADGKQRSSRNAVRHGLTAETVILPIEDVEDYQAFEEAVAASFDPDTSDERELILRLASLLWRLRRATSIETGLFQIGSAGGAEYNQGTGPRPLTPKAVVRILRQSTNSLSNQVECAHREPQLPRAIISPADRLQSTCNCCAHSDLWGSKRSTAPLNGSAVTNSRSGVRLDKCSKRSMTAPTEFASTVSSTALHISRPWTVRAPP